MCVFCTGHIWVWHLVHEGFFLPRSFEYQLHGFYRICVTPERLPNFLFHLPTFLALFLKETFCFHLKGKISITFHAEKVTMKINIMTLHFVSG